MTALLITMAALLPALLKAPSGLFAGLILGVAGTLAVVASARRLIGGYTGDVLGAVEQIAEIGLLLGLAAGAHGLGGARRTPPAVIPPSITISAPVI